MSTARPLGRPRAMRPGVRTVLCGAALVCCLAVLAVFNSGGYRYGASDQAFYVPAIMRHVDPALFPRDRVLIAVAGRPAARQQPARDDRHRHRRCRWRSVLFGAYLIMLLAVAGAGWLFGRALLATRWGAAALVLAMSIRHRVPKTGVNTLEHYFQPRMVAFAFGRAGLAALVRRRTWLALALAIGAGVVHPTTGIWFSIVIGGGARLVVPGTTPPLAGRSGWRQPSWPQPECFYAGALADRLVVNGSRVASEPGHEGLPVPEPMVCLPRGCSMPCIIVVIAVSFRARRRLAWRAAVNTRSSPGSW